MRVEVIGQATLYLGDCREIMPALQRPDAIISDPPYGQKLRQNTFRKGRTTTGFVPQPNGRKMAMTSNVWPDEMVGDQDPFDPVHLLDASDIVLLWSAHKFGHQLPKGRWMGWDKVPTGKKRDQGDGELAWTNVDPDGAFRMFRLLWDGVCVGAGARHEVTRGQKRVHPTQKPEIVMRWAIEQAGVPNGATILDPYCGSGSTGVAALQMGHPFVGIEVVETYFDTACARVEAAQRQAQLFCEGAID